MEADHRTGWLAAATERALLGRAMVTCLIVGALLALINHGDQLLRGASDPTMAWKVGLTFLVPFFVATISGAAAVRSRAGHRHEHLDETSGDKALNPGLDGEAYAMKSERTRTL